jgi:class 3 adenylate cyclase
MTAGVGDLLAEGRAAYEAHDWQQAYERLHAADKETPLPAEDLERLAQAARWSRHFPDVLDAFERAFASYSIAGDKRRAARVALGLAWEHHQRADEAVSTGWYGQATQLLEGDTECAEYALLLFITGFTMVMGGNPDAGRQLLEQARASAQRVGDRDTEGLAHMFLGHALVLLGETGQGLEHVDAATAAAMSGELGVQAAGVIYCSTIFLCRNRGDWRRAGEWTEASLRWCDRESVAGYPGLCRFHRAEVMRFRGDLEAAERDALAAVDELAAAAPVWVGFALHELGEIRRRRGDREGAMEAFTRAAERGFDPQPGLALLRLEDGDIAGARSAIRRALDDDSGLAQEGRALVLPAAVTIELAAGEPDAARVALDELEERARASGSTAFAAAAAQARGELALAGARGPDAVRELRGAVRAWCEVDAPYEAAWARLLLARAYDDERATSDAELERGAARATFERIGAASDARRATELLDEPAERRAIRTFMFTDIVDSTKLVGAIGDTAWQGLLTWHDRTLRACFEAHGGEEVKHEGDGFFVAFPEAGLAVAGACAIQRALADHRRDHGFAPRVRIGLHTSEATERGHDYAGSGVHACARIAAAADGGEILVSRAALQASGEVVPFTNERTLELKGFDTPVDVVSVDWS